MKIKNSTTWSDRFLRRMVSWCCRQIDHPVSKVRHATFRNRSYGCCTGVAYWGDRRFVASVGPDKGYPFTVKHKRRGLVQEFPLADRIDALLFVTAHELAHLKQDRERRRKNVEHDADWHAGLAFKAFQARRAELLAEWSGEGTGDASDAPCEALANEPAPPVVALPAEPEREPEPTRRVALAAPKLSLIERRAARARKSLARWQRKLKLAKSKVRKYAKRVRYYEKKGK